MQDESCVPQDELNLLAYAESMRCRILLLAFALFPAFVIAQTPPSWDQLKAVYDVQPLNDSDVKSQDRTAPEGTYTEFNFTSEGMDTAYGTFVRPNGKGPFPLIVMLHGLGGSRQDMLRSFAPTFLKDGFAVLAMDDPHHGDRATPDDKTLLQKTIFGFAMRKDQSQGLGEYMALNDPNGSIFNFSSDAVVRGTRDIRRAIDWITIPGHRVDAHRIAAVGISLGSIMTSILSGVDDRINADLLFIGGDPILGVVPQLPAAEQSMAYDGSCSLFLGHSTAHVLMMNGYNDHVIPRADTYKLYESAPGAVLSFYDIPGDLSNQLGHGMSAGGYAVGVQWLEKMIDVPKPATREHAKMVAG